MKLNELTRAIRETSGNSCTGISMWIAEMQSPPILAWKLSITPNSIVELTADCKHLLVWHERVPAAEKYELTSHELYMMKEIMEVPMGNCIATPNGIRLAT